MVGWDKFLLQSYVCQFAFPVDLQYATETLYTATGQDLNAALGHALRTDFLYFTTLLII